MKTKQSMNYKPLFFMKLEELGEIVPEFTIGEVLYSFLRSRVLKEETSIRDLKNIDDKTLFKALERAIKLEKDYD